MFVFSGNFLFETGLLHYDVILLQLPESFEVLFYCAN